MKNFMTVLFAGVMLATAAFAQRTNNWANDINRAKLGRDLPAVEKARSIAKCECGMTSCSMADAHAARVEAAHNDAALRASLKTGRYTVTATENPVVAGVVTHNDAQERAFLKTGIRPAAETPVVVAASMCASMGCCKS